MATLLTLLDLLTYPRLFPIYNNEAFSFPLCRSIALISSLALIGELVKPIYTSSNKG